MCLIKHCSSKMILCKHYETSVQSVLMSLVQLTQCTNNSCQFPNWPKIPKIQSTYWDLQITALFYLLSFVHLADIEV